MDLLRGCRHLFTFSEVVKRYFSEEDNAAMTAAVQEAELRTSGEIAVVIEPALEFSDALRGTGGQERALQVFAREHVWDTELNNGVLLYVLIADRDIEIVADRGVSTLVEPAVWSGICTKVEECFRAGKFRDGIILGVKEIGEILARHFPSETPGRGQLDDEPKFI